MSPSEEEDQILEEALSHQCRNKVLTPWQKEPWQTKPRQTEPPLSTRADLTSMVAELKAFFASEMAVLKEDLNMLAGHVRATEESVHNLRIKQDSTTAQTLEIECHMCTAKRQDRAIRRCNKTK
ncbi:Hypothetical predicted protein [Pelobates cultripes]|uniref:Uncharacterized protein n=1 Tax=Pelobates cultripes TaxID=61616 RepID=A0AAD1TI31_PELCU|nr:Hypothetical predicted protein [Pelobates cultripes]